MISAELRPIMNVKKPYGAKIKHLKRNSKKEERTKYSSGTFKTEEERQEFINKAIVKLGPDYISHKLVNRQEIFDSYKAAKEENNKERKRIKGLKDIIEADETISQEIKDILSYLLKNL